MSETDNWESFVPSGGWSKNYKNRLGQRYKYMDERCKKLAGECRSVEYGELLDIVIKVNWGPRYKARVFVSMAETAAEHRMPIQSRIWDLVLQSINDDKGKYDFLECIPPIITTAIRFGWMNSELAIKLTMELDREAKSSCHGWDDWHLSDSRQLIDKMKQYILV